jgi:ribosomal protein L7/L12
MQLTLTHDRPNLLHCSCTSRAPVNMRRALRQVQQWVLVSHRQQLVSITVCPSAASVNDSVTRSVQSLPGPYVLLRQLSTSLHLLSEAATEKKNVVGNAKVQALADQILALTVLESSWLTELLRDRLGVPKQPAMGMGMMMPQMMAGLPMASQAPAAAAAAPNAAGSKGAADAEEQKPEKATHDVKLESFTAEGKIKVIKEIRAITSLGLKEAKELVSV